MEAFTLLHKEPTKVGHGRSLYGAYSKHKSILGVYNALGYNIFWTINQTDGKGRRAENIVAARYAFADYDNGLPTFKEAPPSIIVQSSPGRYQAYWELEEATADFTMWQRLQDSLVRETGGDMNARDLARIFRVPGYLNHKREDLFMVYIVKKTQATYTLAHLADTYGLAPVTYHAASDVVSEKLWPNIPERLRRWKCWLEKQEWPAKGDRNGCLFSWAAKGVREFAVPVDVAEETLEELWWQHEGEGDSRLEQLVNNAYRSGRSPFGSAYSIEDIRYDESDM